MIPRHVISLVAALSLWLGCVAAGFAALQRYSSGAGDAHAPRSPAGFLSANRHPDRPLVIMAVHPRCPCTAASLAELGDLLARSRGACDAVLLQYTPESDDPAWRHDVLPRELGGVKVGVHLDPGGKIAASFGAATSGHVVFVDATGVIRFTGGITVSRGHRGRAPGQDAILEFLRGAASPFASSPSFGCALQPECSAPASP